MKRLFFLAAAAGGFLAVAAPAAAQRHVPPGHLPPAGLCRVWLPGVPPGHQPQPMRCNAAERYVARHGGQVIYGGRGGPVMNDDWNDRRFVRWAVRNFDFNRDGRLSRRELRAAQAAWHRR